jgi:hypothetical protein
MIAGEWTPLAGPGGTLLGLAGAHTAAAQRGRITVWEDERELASVEAAWTGRPLVGTGEVRCGELIVSLDGGAVRRVHPALGEGTGVATPPPPGSGYRAEGAVWSPDGEALLVAAAWTGAAGPPPARALLFDGDGRHVTTLWEGSDRAPGALWAGDELLVVGTRAPRVYTRAGTLVNVLDAEVPPVRIDGDERRLLIVEHGRITLWDTAGWQQLARWDGGWLDAGLAPGRDVAVAIDLTGALHALPLSGSAPQALETPDPAQSLAVGERRIVASFMRGAAVRTAALT